MSKKKTIKETAAAGSTGGGAIGVVATRMGDMQRRQSLKDFLIKFSNNIKNKMVMKPVQLSPIREFYDLSDVVSRLKGIEGADEKKADVVVYGVEDDEGNIMKISVKKDQAKDFEYRLARDMADAKDTKMSGAKSNVSLAELLYDLKDEFNIVDVEFPTIPKDVIYNADKATYGPDSTEIQGNDEVGDDVGMDNMEMDADMEGGMDMEGGDLEGGDMDMEGGEDLEMSDEEMDMEGEDGEELEMDDESVEDFAEEPEAATPESLLQSVMDMLKADAEAKKAQADAEAEKARAQQAEYAYKSSQATVAQQEEYAQMELDMEQQKQKEKEAKKLADLAKHRVQKTAVMRESAPSILEQVIMEIDQFDTVQSINRARREAQMKFRIAPQDTPEDAQYKQRMLAQSMRELDARLKAVKTRDAFVINQTKKEQAQDRTQQQQAMNRNNPSGLNANAV